MAEFYAEIGDGLEFGVGHGDRVLQLAGEAVIARIGEATNRLPEAFRSEFSAIPWRQIIDMRNRLVHHYEVTDPDQVWGTLERSIPELVESLGLNEIR